MMNNKKAMIMICVLMLVVGIAGGYVYSHSKTNKTDSYSKLIISAQDLVQDQSYDKAIEDYLAAIKIKPFRVEAYIEASDVYTKIYDYGKAIDLLNQASEYANEIEKEKIEDLIDEYTNTKENQYNMAIAYAKDLANYTEDMEYALILLEDSGYPTLFIRNNKAFRYDYQTDEGYYKGSNSAVSHSGKEIEFTYAKMTGILCKKYMEDEETCKIEIYDAFKYTYTIQYNINTYEGTYLKESATGPKDPDLEELTFTNESEMESVINNNGDGIVECKDGNVGIASKYDPQEVIFNSVNDQLIEALNNGSYKDYLNGSQVA